MSISIPRRTRRGRGGRAFLLLVGSILALTAYNWLLRSTSVSVVATYAYVNPAIAVLLGWLVLSEAVTTITMLGAAVVVAGVVLVVTAERRVEHEHLRLDPRAGDGSWYWHLVEAELRSRGHHTVAPDLPVDDSATLDDYADVVIEAVGDHDDVIVVGQSFGAFTAPLVADQLTGHRTRRSTLRLAT